MNDKENKTPKDERAERLNAALRSNLQRRKAATRRPSVPPAGEEGAQN
ncbi:MAG: hypothetical protein QM667_14060 [Asticcacaulis sp.]